MAENMEEEKNEVATNENSDEEDMNEESGDSDSDDTTEQDEAKVRELEKEISKNPYLYNSHVELIKKLRDLGDLERLREARQSMQKYFPLSEEIWLEWLRDEVPLVSEQEERDKVEALFKLAVSDYVSVVVWLEYVQFVIGGMGGEGGVEHVREVFEQAVTAVGLHVNMGTNVWEAYREFENALLAGLMPQAGVVTTKDQEEAFNIQHQKIANLFKRQLAVPLMDMEETFAEYKEWLGGTVDPEVEKVYQKALETLHKLKPFESNLLAAEAPHLVEYQKYLDFELSEGDPARIQCLFERALLENCLLPDLWAQYTKFLDEKLKIGSISMATYERALRNCPWSGTLWRNYILTLERSSQPFDVIKGAMDRALTAGLTDASDYLLVWTAYCDYLRRQIDWSQDHEKELETFRLTVERAADHLYENFGTDGDPEASLRQFWAELEARHCNNLDKARELWNQVMQEGYGSQASMWLNYYRLERTFGDVKHCRRILQRALNSVADWLECITQTYLDFERQEGTLEDYETAYSKCEAQLARVNERKAKAAEREAAIKEQKKMQRVAVSKGQKKGEKAADKGDHSSAPAEEVVAQAISGKWSSSVTGARVMSDNSRKRKTLQEPVTGASAADWDQPPEKKIREEDEHGQSIQHDPAKDNVTVFVSNLDYHLPEDSLRQFFAKCGEIVELRLVKNFKGLSKGFGYVQFSDANGSLAALKKDREQLEGRPVFVSRCEDRGSGKRTHQFKYATELEKNKLFVKNLPFTCSREALEKIFGEEPGSVNSRNTVHVKYYAKQWNIIYLPHGKLKEVRLVTYRSGAPKGLAYVEYETQEMAAQAVLKLDGLQLGEHAISVAISNPPQRKQPLNQHVPSLGSGKKDTEIRGKARTQVALLPRAVQRPAATPTFKHPGEATSTQSSAPSTTGSEGTKGKMSNDDFRKMLFK